MVAHTPTTSSRTIYSPGRTPPNSRGTARQRSLRLFHQIKLGFSHYNIGALFKLAHMPEFSSESALAGTVYIEGFGAARALRGEAHLDQLAVTVAGVHLESKGSVHATLADSLIRLDPCT